MSKQSPELLARTISDRLAQLPRRLDLLKRAMAEFGGEFNRQLFLDAFESDDLVLGNKVSALERDFEQLLNALAEIVRAGTTLAQFAPAKRRFDISADLEKLAEQKVISRRQVTIWTRLQRARNDLQHDYIELSAEELYDAVKLLLNNFSILMTALSNWIVPLSRGLGGG